MRVLLVMCAGMFLVLLDVTVVNVAVPTIAADLDTGTAGVQWVVDGYTVALAGLLLAGGALADRLGHRAVVLAGLAVFGMASAGCSLAPTVAVLVTARIAQGVGAALFLPGSVAAIADAHPGRTEQARALGIWAGVSALALPAGPLLGGALVQTLGWRAVFWINPPVVALCLAGVGAVVPAAVRRPTPVPVRSLAAATLALAAAVFAVIAAGDAAGAGTVGGLAAGVAVVAAIGFVRGERRAAHPLLPRSLLAGPEFPVAVAAALVMNLTGNGLLFVLTRYLQSVLGQGPFTAGLMLLPLFLPLAILSPAAGRLTARHGPRRVLLAGAATAAAGQLCLLAVTPAASYLALLPTLVGVGAGLALFTAPVVTVAIRAVAPGQSGLANGVVNTARQAGTALGVALFGAVAGPPERAGTFLGGLHALGVGAAVLWVAVAALIGTAVAADVH